MKYQILILNFPKEGDTYFIMDTYDNLNFAHHQAELNNHYYKGRSEKYIYFIREEPKVEKDFVGPICWHCRGQHAGINCEKRKK